MFKCARCHESVPGLKPVMVTVEMRPKVYEPRENVYEMPDGTTRNDPGGQGYEIVKQIAVHDLCPGQEVSSADELSIMNMLVETFNLKTE